MVNTHILIWLATCTAPLCPAALFPAWVTRIWPALDPAAAVVMAATPPLVRTVLRRSCTLSGGLLGGGRGLAPGHHVVPVHVVGLGHAGRLARGPAEGLRLGRRHGLVDAGLGRRQWLVVRIPGRRTDC